MRDINIKIYEERDNKLPSFDVDACKTNNSPWNSKSSRKKLIDLHTFYKHVVTVGCLSPEGCLSHFDVRSCETEQSAQRTANEVFNSKRRRHSECSILGAL